MRDLSNIKIKDISQDELKYWLLGELNELSDDLDVNIDDNQLNHIPRKMTQVLSERFKNWDTGTIHSIFQKGVSGAYGKPGRITVSMLINWITQEDKLKRGENVGAFIPMPDYPSDEVERFNRIADQHLPFMRWCMTHGVDISAMDTEQVTSDGRFMEGFNARNLRNEFNRNGADYMVSRLPELPRVKFMGTVNYLTR